jgi:hypothetical protein
VSYRNLAPDLQDFFRRLSLHPGATVEEFAAAALADASVPEAAEHLDISHREALLTEVGYRRYSTHDLIRRYARDRAAADPAAGRERALDRLLDVYTRAAWAADVWLAHQSGTGQAPAPSAAPVAIPDLSDATQALAWARTERVNLLACLDHVTSTGQHARVVALTAALATLFRQEGPWAESISRCAAGVRAARRRHRGGGYPAGRRAAGPFAAAEGADRAVATCHSESPRTGQRLLHLLLPQASMAENPMQGSTRPAVSPARGHHRQIVGNGVDYSASVSGLMSSATGSFDSITPGATETSNGAANSFSLQLNAKPFTTTVCAGSGDPANCQGGSSSSTRPASTKSSCSTGC